MKEIDKNQFDKIINEEDIFLLEFGAVWCKPCKTIEPILESLELERLQSL